MPQVKRKTPEQFVAQSPIGEKLSRRVFERNLASGALRFAEINGQPQEHRKLGNKEAKIREVLESGYFGIINKNPEFVDEEINGLLIDEADVPQSYYDLQRRIARERGYGDIEITDKLKEEAVRTLQTDQAESLVEWSEYLRSDENGHVYPDWFKVYVWESLKKMGEFDKEKGKFKKRAKSTTAPWSELNAEALAYVWDKIDESVIKGGAVDDGKLANLLNNGNFSTLYAHALHEAEVGGITPELREITEGSWVKYDQIQGNYDPYYHEEDGEYIDDAVVDNDTAMSLAQSLRSWNTGWCTAGTRTAAHQLSMGDFYVYYTQDEEGKDAVPRVAIRMEDGSVAEVRGINPDQNLEGNMVDIAAEKLKTLPGGDKYFEKAEDMKRLTEIDERVKSGGELTTDDIVFLRFSGEVEGFGWGEDPRVGELLQDRGFESDLGMVLSDESVDPNVFANKLVETDGGYAVANYLDKLLIAGADPYILVDKMLERDMPYSIMHHLDELLAACDPTILADKLLEENKNGIVVAKHIDKFLAAGAEINTTAFMNRLIEGGWYDVAAENVDKFIAAGAEISPTTIMNKLLENSEHDVIARHIDKLLIAGADIDLTTFMNELTEKGWLHVVAENLDKLLAAGAEINPTALANKLTEEGWSFYVESNIGKFLAAGVDHEYLEKLLKD